MRINLTQHDSTPDQGCAPRTDALAKAIKQYLTFTEIPDLADITRRAVTLAGMAVDAGADEAMIGGVGYLVLALDPALRVRGVKPVYAFSKRETQEKVLPDGSVRKVTVFRHLGFVRF